MFYNREKLQKYIKKVCRNKLLREAVESYFDDFFEKYEGITVTRDMFETIKYNGKVVEQNAVKTLFKDKEKVSFEEVMIYLFIKNVKKVKHFNLFETINNPSLSGMYYPTRKIVSIKRKSPKRHIQNYIFVNGTGREIIELTRKNIKELTSTPHGRDLYQSAKEYAKNQIKREINHVVCHELGHVFDVKSFKGGKILKSDMTNLFYVKNLFIAANHWGSEITTKSVLTARIREKFWVNDEFERLKYNTIIEGATEISEIFNEAFACQLDKNYFIEDFDPQRSEYASKKVLVGNCSYNANIDIYNLIYQSLEGIDPFEFRFNTTKVIDGINNYEISEETKEFVKLNLVQELCRIAIHKGYEYANLRSEFETFVNKMDTYQLICLSMGIDKKQKDLKIEDAKNTKVLAQILIIENYKNKIISAINNENVKKNKEFFHNLNNILTIIDNYILYPNEKVDYVHNKFTFDLFSVMTFGERYPFEKHIQDFADIVRNASECLEKNRDRVYNIDDVSSFFEKQKELDSRLEMYNESKQASISEYDLFEQRSNESYEER